MKKGPCLGCDKRAIEPVNCHSYCELYLGFRESCDNELQERLKHKRVNDYMFERQKKLHK